MDVLRQPEALGRAVWIVLLNALAAILLLVLLWQLRTLVSWVLVGALLAVALQPLVGRLERRGVKHGLSVLLVFLMMLAIIVLFFALLLPMVVAQAGALIERAPELLERLRTSSLVEWADARFGVIERAQSYFQSRAGQVAEPALRLAAGLVQGLVAVVTVLVLAVFMLLFGRDVFQRALVWFPPPQRKHVAEVAERVHHAVGGYIVGVLVVASIGALVMSITLAILGVPYFLPLGMIMLFLAVIPYVGTTLAAVIIVGLTFAAVGMRAALICLAVFLVYQQIENNVLQPLVQRRTLRMNPLLIFLSVLAGAMLAGILGALLALPVAAAVQVLLQDALSRREERWNRLVLPPGSSSPASP